MKPGGGTRPTEAPVAVGTLEELDRLCREEVAVDFTAGGRRMRVMARRLTPREAGRVRELLTRALPPLLPQKPGEEEPRFDFTNPAYRAEKEKYERQGRALAVWLGCEVYRRAFPDLKSAEEIQEAVEGMGTDEMLQAIYLRIAGRGGGVLEAAGEEAALVNFS